MQEAYLGIDIGSISTKGVIIDRNAKIIAKDYLWTNGDPIQAVKNLLVSLEKQCPYGYQIIGVGTTGSARKLIGTMLNATVIKNEITAHAVGTLSLHPDVRTIFEIGGQDSKIILIENGIVVDYAMNTLCAAGTGSFLSSQAKRLDVPVEEFGKIALTSKNPTKIAARCTVFAESDLVHKAQMGYRKEDVSKNIGVVKAFEDITKEPILVDENGHLMGCFGVAILALRCPIKHPFSFQIKNHSFTTSGIECQRCPNHCEIICVRDNNRLIDAWGNRCERGAVTK